MMKSFGNLAVACALATGVSGCVGTAGVSTWEYQSGPGFETERVYENRIEADSHQGVSREACTRVIRRQADGSGGISERDGTSCQSN